MEVPTVRIKDDKAPGGYVVINESDYDADKHTLLTNRQEAAASSKIATADAKKTAEAEK